MDGLVQCVNCENFTLKEKTGASPMARHGCGHCRGEPEWTYFGALRERQCKKFSRASEAVILPRMQFLEKKEQ